MARLTVKKLENLRPKSGQYEIAEEGGLRFRVYPSGRKTFIHRYKDLASRQRVLKLGEWPTITLADDHLRLAEVKVLREQGIAPSDRAAQKKEKRREGYRAQAAAPSVADILDEYMTRHVLPKCKTATQAEFRRLIERELKPRLGRREAADVKRSAIVAELDSIADEATS
ncbi:MAG: Arm DNA-binding domain-containing protein, partial [Gammaproteobacteria bacterium]